uniref:uncharacterized protein LOC122609508 n=1 Tax=Erigeron canadensis TaxID=72917 RepID=UPI001CB90852|nr:uncharacterized protein LOC122609508 [Erigeron canadensis]
MDGYVVNLITGKMGNNGSLVKVNVFIDKNRQKVMFAEAQEDFVEIVFSFMTLPLGTIARASSNLRGGSQDIKLGSLTSLYQSLLKLQTKLFSNRNTKHILLYPLINSSSNTLCQKLKVNLYPSPYTDRHGNPVLLNNKGSFLITDDLQVTPYSLDQSILLLKALDVKCFDLLEKRTIVFGFREFSDLLKWSLVTDSPLTNLVLGGRNKPKPQLYVPNSKLGGNYSTAQPRMIKLLVQKSTKKVICAQVHNFFVEMLFSFQTIPLGAAKRLTMDTAVVSTLGIDNVYNSISRLGDAGYLKSEDVKIMLLDPKVSSSYRRVTDFLPIYERDTCRGHFLKKEESFVVSDDLKISLMPSISELPNLTLGIPAGDIEVMDLSIGEQEALLILKASLTSASALTDFLNTFM